MYGTRCTLGDIELTHSSLSSWCCDDQIEEMVALRAQSNESEKEEVLELLRQHEIQSNAKLTQAQETIESLKVVLFTNDSTALGREWSRQV